MAHFAQLNDSNEVIFVSRLDNSDCLDGDGNESEAVGIAYNKALFGSDTIWVQTSINDSIRGQCATLTMNYDAVNDVFYERIKPEDLAGDICNSWVYDTSNGKYNPPLSDPDQWTPSNKTGKLYKWVEAEQQKDNTKGWVELVPHSDYASWVWSSDKGTYESPVARPDDGKEYDWDDDAYKADNSKGWVEA